MSMPHDPPVQVGGKFAVLLHEFIRLMRRYTAFRGAGLDGTVEAQAVLIWAMRRYIEIYQNSRAGSAEARAAFIWIIDHASATFMFAVRKKAREFDLLPERQGGVR